MRHRGPFNMRARFAAVALFGVAMCLLWAAMLAWREAFEPVIRTLHPLLLGRHSHASYEAADYIAYEVVVGLFGLIPFAVLYYGTATKSRTDRKIDRYLDNRLTRHAQTLSGDESERHPLD